MYSIKSRIESKPDLIIMILLAVVAFGSRLIGLGEWAFYMDELYTINLASERMHTLINPAYYALVEPLLNTYGISELIARIPSFLLGTLGVPVFYLIARSMFSRNVALVGSLLVLFSEWHIYHSQLCRFYTGVFLFGNLAYYFFYRATKLNSILHLSAGLLFSLIASLFHLTAILIPASFWVYSIFLLFFKNSSAQSKRIPILFLSAGIIACLAATPFLWSIWAKWSTATGGWGHGPHLFIIQLAKYLQFPIAVAALSGLLLLLKRDFQFGVFMAISTGLPLIIMVVAAQFVDTRPDYLFYSVPLFFMLAAYLCAEIGKTLKKNKYGLMSYSLSILLIICMLPEMISHYSSKMSLDERHIISYLESSYRPGDKVLTFPTAVEHYAKNRFDFVRRPAISSSNIDWNSALKEYSESKERLWIVTPIK